MALKSGRCSGKTIQYDATCTFHCGCGTFRLSGGFGTITICGWSVKCGGKVVSSGTARPRVRPKEDTHYVDGRLTDVASTLEEIWGRSVTVPRAKRGDRVTGQFKGSPEQICEGLGLKLED